VVLVLGAFLLAVVAALASETREQASRVLCKANLAKIGQAMRVYAGDYDGALPRAGGPTSEWGAVVWNASDRYGAFGISADGEGGHATISSCFYLLVKYLEVPTRLFVCPGDRGTSEFSLAEEGMISGGFKLANAWDFGSTPSDNGSYAYHMPLGPYALMTSLDPNLPVAADRNPWIKSPAATAGDFSLFMPDVNGCGGIAASARSGNARSHQLDGQNVLFLDGCVTFEQRSSCGVDQDNIYTKSQNGRRGDPLGVVPMARSGVGSQPYNKKDSLLLHDPPSFNVPR